MRTLSWHWSFFPGMQEVFIAAMAREKTVGAMASIDIPSFRWFFQKISPLFGLFWGGFFFSKPEILQWIVRL
jgi:hypothetical protein